jgi:hypothetical protein
MYTLYKVQVGSHKYRKDVKISNIYNLYMVQVGSQKHKTIFVFL